MKRVRVKVKGLGPRGQWVTAQVLWQFGSVGEAGVLAGFLCSRL